MSVAASPSQLRRSIARASLIWLACLLVCIGSPWDARARVLEVGPTRSITTPSAALIRAEDGDTIAIDEGEYFDCLRVRTPSLTIEGLGAGAVLSDLLCDGKASLVMQADDLTLRNLTFTRIRAPDGNGAGIRAEARNLTIENSRFINNQAAILANGVPDSTITISDSVFERNGVCVGERCIAAILVGPVLKLRIERSRMSGTRGAHQIASSASLTSLVGNTIEDGPQGSASYQVAIPVAASLLMEDNVLVKGPNAANTRGAVVVFGDGWSEDGETLIFRRNVFRDQTGQNVPFVRNWSPAKVEVEGNKVEGGGAEITDSGYWLYRLRGMAATMRDEVRAGVGFMRRVARWGIDKLHAL